MAITNADVEKRKAPNEQSIRGRRIERPAQPFGLSRNSGFSIVLVIRTGSGKIMVTPKGPKRSRDAQKNFLFFQAEMSSSKGNRESSVS